MLTSVPKQAAAQLDQPQVVAGLLGVTNQNRPTLAHPAQRPLHDPPAGGKPLTLLLIEFFLTNPSNVRNIICLSRHPASGGIVIALVQAQVLRCILCRLGPIYNDRLNGLPEPFGIVDIGGRHDHPQRTAVGLDDHTTFGAIFRTIRGVGTDIIPP